MNDLIPFEFEGRPVRVLRFEDGTVLFVARDVASALGYVDTVKAVKTHCKHAVTLETALENKGGRFASPTEGSDLQPNTLLLPEGDVIRLVIRSKLPLAEPFERKVFDEILPSIRKTGSYVAPGAIPPSFEAMDEVELATRAFALLLDRYEQVKNAATAEREKRLLLTKDKLDADERLRELEQTVKEMMERWRASLNASYGAMKNVDKLVGGLSQRKLFDDPKVTKLPKKDDDQEQQG